MAVSGPLISISYTGDSISVLFPVPFYFMATSDLVVTSTNDITGIVTKLIEGTDYTVFGTSINGVNPSGGAVVLMSAASSPLGATLLIARQTPATQGAVFQPEGPFPAKTLETALDRAVLQIQEMMAGYKGVTSGTPTWGTWAVGDWFRITPAVAGGMFGIVCTTAGVAGVAVWNQFGDISL